MRVREIVQCRTIMLCYVTAKKLTRKQYTVETPMKVGNIHNIVGLLFNTMGAMTTSKQNTMTATSCATH